MQNMQSPVFPWQTIIEFFMWSVAGQGGKLELNACCLLRWLKLSHLRLFWLLIWRSVDVICFLEDLCSSHYLIAAINSAVQPVNLQMWPGEHVSHCIAIVGSEVKQSATKENNRKHTKDNKSAFGETITWWTRNNRNEKNVKIRTDERLKEAEDSSVL